ncbi:MAG: acetolactate synthase large subunit, partial [Cyanobacteria bacterium]|nr:acetolactate synthase large subunit [Cyanobacteriota bacterium]
VRKVEDLAQAVKEAFYVATSGRPGPVLVDITRDVLVAKTHYNKESVTVNLPGFVSRETLVEEESLNQKLGNLSELLGNCRKPVLLSGGGVITAGAYDEVLQFAELLNIPVASSLMGLGGFPSSHPLSLGFAGMHGHYAANIAIAEADLLLVVGNRLNERQTGNPNRFAKHAKIVHFDLDPTTLEKNVETFLPIQGDLKQVFQKLLEKMTQTPDSMSLFQESLDSRAQWLETIEGFKRRRKNDAALGNDSEPENPGAFPSLLTPQWVIERLYQWLPSDAFVTTEVGQHQMWAAQRFNLDKPRSFISSGGLGTMGFGFPAAIGIQVAHPEATVLDIAGDGSFQMTLQELATAMDHRLPVKVAIINNGHLGMIRQWQGKMYTRESQAKLSSPDYVKLAEAYGCQGFEIVDPASADEVIQ